MGKKLNLAAGGLLVYAAVQALPTAQMEAEEPGSSIEYRENNAEAVHAGMESVTLAVQDGLGQVGPLLQSLTLQLQAGLAPLAAQQPPAAPGSTLPSPVLGQ